MDGGSPVLTTEESEFRWHGTQRQAPGPDHPCGYLQQDNNLVRGLAAVLEPENGGRESGGGEARGRYGDIPYWPGTAGPSFHMPTLRSHPSKIQNTIDHDDTHLQSQGLGC